MIEVTRGDILKADAEALVNTCKHHEVQPGRMLIVETGQLTRDSKGLCNSTQGQEQYWKQSQRIVRTRKIAASERC